MRCHKTLKRFISFLCAVSMLFSVCSLPTFAVTANTVTATTNNTVKQGNTAYCYVYIDSTESLGALDVTVHFDPTKIKINNVYNSVNCTLYDSVTNNSNIQFSYIFDGEGSSSKTQLFYFTYQVLSNAEVGNAYFDITIGEAYDNSLNDVAISGFRCNFTIDETVTTKSCSVYSSSSVSTAIEEEFSLNYRFSTYQIASGSAVITYDSELFEVVEVTNGEFLTDKLADINTDLTGAIYISFVGTVYNTNTGLITVKFKTLKNVTKSSEINFKVTELHDIDINAISCSGYTTTASVEYDESYTGDAPKMKVHAECDENDEKVTAVINLEKNSKLGAGDFVLAFDPAVLALSSYEKGFEPSFFNINDKEAADGLLKFSVISLEDIVTAETVISVTFNTIQTCVEQNTTLDISGSMLSDSLTNKIVLSFINGKVNIPEKHTYSGECDTICNKCGFIRNAYVSHNFSDIKDTSCNYCGQIRVLEHITVTSTPNKCTYLEGKDLLDVSGGKITLYYDDGTFGSINMAPNMVTGFDNTVVGKQTLSVTYGGKKSSFTVEVIAKSLTSIAVTTKPSKIIYAEGMPFDKTGMVVAAYYNNGTSAVISNYTISGYSSTVGTKTITVSYGGKTAFFNVTVEAKKLTTIAVTSKPTKLTYLEGEAFDKSGMVVTAYYNNNSSGVVTNYTVSGYTSTPGTKTITVTYGGKTTTFTVTVKSGVPQSVTSSKFTVSGNKISKISAGTTVSTLLNGISEGSYCKVYNGNSVVSGSSNVGTGMVVKIMDGNTAKASYTVIVTGDTNGDGNITVTDMIAIKAHVLKKSTLSGVYAIAADTNGDSGISITDFIQVKAKILGKGSITAR